MLSTHDSLYLKPESGKAGKGIMRLKYREDVSLPYRLQIQSGKKNATYKAASMDRLWARISKEKTIPLYCAASHSARNTPRAAFRSAGTPAEEWPGRLGSDRNRCKAGRRPEHYNPCAARGSIEEPATMLEGTFGPERAAAILKNVPTTALLIARQIERASEMMLGEMSMDLGVDEAGDLWFFEANSRPMKFDEPAIRKLSLERIFQYSQHLARMNK